MAALVPYRLGLVGPARFVRPVTVVVGIAVLGGCASLDTVSEVSVGSAGSTQGTGVRSDAGTEASAPATPCHPGSVETFTAPIYRHAASLGQGLCDPLEISDYYANCLTLGASKSSCDAYAQSRAHAVCAACITTVETASVYGPLVLVNGFVQANVAGCIEVEDPSDRSCALAQQALSDCELAACAVNCPVVDQSSFLAYEACKTQVDATGCQAYFAAAQCLGAEVGAGDAGPESVCFAPDFQTFYYAIVPLFCGAFPGGDAGDSDASSSDAGAAEDSGSLDGASSDGQPDAPVADGGSGPPGDASLHDGPIPPDGGLDEGMPDASSGDARGD